MCSIGCDSVDHPPRPWVAIGPTGCMGRFVGVCRVGKATDCKFVGKAAGCKIVGEADGGVSG